MNRFIAFLNIVFLVSIIHSVSAKNNIKIATIGAVSPNLDLNQEPQKLVEQMIEFWNVELAQVLPDHPDLIVLPEVCDRPAGMDAETQMKYYETRGNQMMEYFASIAKENSCYIAFGANRRVEDGSWRNSCILIDRKGNTVGYYNKNFPTIWEMESGIKAGKEAPVFQCDFGKVAAVICFDLNFDELREMYAAQKPDVLLFPSLYHGGLAQANWAYSNRSFFVGAVGVANLPSEIRNPMGKVISTSTNYFHYTVTTINLDYCLAHLDFNGEKFKALKKRYGKDVIISDPGEIGSVIITSESEKVSALDMVKEFEITLLDDYLDNSRNYRQKPGVMEQASN